MSMRVTKFGDVQADGRSRKSMFGLLIGASASAIALAATPAIGQVVITDNTKVLNPGTGGVTSAPGVTQTVSDGDNIELENNTNDGATITLGGTHINTDSSTQDVVIMVDNAENDITINVLATGVLQGVNGVIFYEGDRMVLTNDGLIEGTGDAEEGVVYIDRDADGLVNTITNNGTIRSVNGAAIGVDTLLGNDPKSTTIGDEEGIARVTIVNTGTIENTNGDDTNEDNDAINFDADNTISGGNIRGCLEGALVLCQVELNLTNSGTISAARDNAENAAIRVENDVVMMGSIVNETTGIITGGSNAITISGAHADHNLDIENDGTITGTSSSGIWITGAGVRVQNLANGTISGGDEGIRIEGSVITINPDVNIPGVSTMENVAVAADGITVENDGEITGGEAGIFFGDNAADGVVTNNSTGIVTGGFGVASVSGGTVTNEGTIEGTSGAALSFSGDADATVNLGADSTTTGASTNAVEFDGAGVHTLNIAAGATITGALSGSATGTADSLVLSGSGDGGTLSVNNFEDVTISGGEFIIDAASTGFGDGIFVDGGTLFFNGTSSGGANVTAGALGGTGTIGGDVTIASGATLSPGASGVGTLAIGGDLVLSGSSILDYDIGNPYNSASSDLTTVGGDLTLDGQLRVTDVGGFGSGTYTILTYGGTLTDNGLTINSMPAGFALSDGQIQTSVAGEVNLVVLSGVPNVLFFDGADLVADGNVDGGSGVWNLTSTNWTDLSGNTNSAWDGSFAIFSGMAGGTVTLGADVGTYGFQFSTDGYEITSGAGTNTIELKTVGSAARVASGMSATISAPLIGAGGIDKLEDGTLFLSGTNTYTGDTTIFGGTLVLDGGLVSNTSVMSGATLAGSGTTAGTINVASGGTLSPGFDGIGTLSSTNNVTFAAGSVFEVDVLADGSSDLFSTTGSAQINGGTVSVLSTDTAFNPSTDYTILQATGGVSGEFDDVTTDLAFLDPTLTYDSNSVMLNLTRNDVGFGDIGQTFNQAAVGAVIDSLGDNDLTAALLVLNAEDALNAYDQLSGEIHASVRAVITEEQRVVRNAVLNHLASNVSGGHLWGQAWRQYADTNFNGNASGVDSDGWGALIGADFGLGSNANIGLAVSYQDSDFALDRFGGDASGLGTGTLETVNALAYLGVDLFGLRLRAGGGYGWSDIETQRDVSFGTYEDSLSADYDGGNTFGFAEIGYPIVAGVGVFEPYVGVRFSEVSTGDFNEVSAFDFGEMGGSAALRVAKGFENSSAATAGLRISSAAEEPLQIKVNLGYEHGFGDRVSSAVARFEDGQSFVVQGTEQSENGGFLQAEVSTSAMSAATVGLVFDAFVGDQTQQIAGGVKVSLGF